MKVLVIGGAGYIGSVLSSKLLQAGFKVVVLDNLLFGGESIISMLGKTNFQFIKGDVCSSEEVKNSLKNVQAVINLAALVGEHACKPQPKLAWQVNYKGAVDLAKLAKRAGIKRFIFVSTCSNYGISDVRSMADENSPVNPISLYAETKVKAEKEILVLSERNFFPYILRLATVFGLSPRMRFDLLLNELVKDAYVFSKLKVYQPESWRPVVHVNDVSQAIVSCLKLAHIRKNQQIINIGFGNYQKRQLVSMIKKYLPKTKIDFVQKRSDNRDYRVSFTKMRQILGFKCHISPENGIKELFMALKSGFFFEPQHFRYNNTP